MNKSKFIISNYKFLIVFIFLSMSCGFSYKGQLWLDTNYIDKSDNFWYFGYISELSLKGNNNLDFEWSRKLLSENHSLSSANKNENYRLWLRYTHPVFSFILDELFFHILVCPPVQIITASARWIVLSEE